ADGVPNLHTRQDNNLAAYGRGEIGPQNNADDADRMPNGCGQRSTTPDRRWRAILGPYMKIAAMVILNAVRVLGLILLVLGFMFWSGRSYELVPVHMRIGEVLIGLLWILAAMGLRSGLSPGLVLGAMFYG